MEEKKELDVSFEILKGMADIMYELQLSLEPLRDKALDEKARLTGYAQCAEQMLKIIATRAEYLKIKAREKELEDATQKTTKKTTSKKIAKKESSTDE